MAYKQGNNPFSKSVAKLAAAAGPLIQAVAPAIAGKVVSKAMDKKDSASKLKSKAAGKLKSKAAGKLKSEDNKPFYDPKKPAPTQTEMDSIMNYNKQKFFDSEKEPKDESPNSSSGKLKHSAAKVKDVAGETIERISKSSGVTDQEGYLGQLDLTKKESEREVEKQADSDEAFYKSFDNPKDKKNAKDKYNLDITNQSDLDQYIKLKEQDLGYTSKTTEKFTPLEEQGGGDLAANKTAYEQRKDFQKQKRTARRLSGIIDKDDPTFGGSKRQRKKKLMREHLLRTDPTTGETMLSDQARSMYGDASTFQKRKYDPSRLTSGFKSATKGGLVSDTEENRKKYGHMTREQIEAQLSDSAANLKMSAAKLKKNGPIAKLIGGQKKRRGMLKGGNMAGGVF